MPERNDPRALPRVTTELDDAIRHGVDLRPGEVAAAWTLIVNTRGADPDTGEWVGRRLRFVPDGCDPHMTLGLLDAETAKLRHEIA